MKENLNLVLENNKKWPLLLKNVMATQIANSVVIEANISNSELAVLPVENGTEVPKWLKELQVKCKIEKNAVLVINNIDSVMLEEQEKREQ